VIDCNEWKTEKGHECTGIGKVKRLELWWQLYLTSLLERDVRNIRPLDFCWIECTCTWSRSTALWFLNKHAKGISAVFVTWPPQAESRHVPVEARSRTEIVPAFRWVRRFGKKGLHIQKRGHYRPEKTFQFIFHVNFVIILLRTICILLIELYHWSV